MKKFFSNSFIVSFFLLLSKILGFVRDLLLASFFGSSVVMQAFLVAFRFPEFIRKVTSSGILVQVINPYLYGQINNRHKRFIASILYFLAVFMLLITIVCIIFSNAWVSIYGHGFVEQEDIRKLVVDLFVIMIPYILFNTIMGVISAVLNSYSRYLISSILPIFLNIIMIIGIVVSPQFEIPIYAVAYSVLLAGVIQVVIGVFALTRVIGKVGLDTKVFLIRNIKARYFLRKFPTAFFGTAILQINSLIETFFASFLISGSLAWLYYADRVNQFLYGVFGTAIATVIIPYLIKSKSNKQQFYNTLILVIRFALIITIPALVGLYILAKPIVITLFYYGEFRLYDVDFTYLAMIGYLISLFCFILVRVVVSALYTINKTKIVFKISLMCLVLTLCLDTLVINLFEDSKYAFLYLTFVTSLVSLSNLFIQLLILAEFNLRNFIKLYISFSVLLKVLIGCICMIIVLHLFDLSDSYWINLSMSERLVNMLKIVSSGAFTYLGIMLLLRIFKSLKVVDE